MIQFAAEDRHTARHRLVTFEWQMVEDLERWRDTDPETGRHVVELIERAIENPRTFRGRPKRLGGLRGAWNVRITKAHRLFYLVDDYGIHFLSCYAHDLPDSTWRALHEDSFQIPWRD